MAIVTVTSCLHHIFAGDVSLIFKHAAVTNIGDVRTGGCKRALEGKYPSPQRLKYKQREYFLISNEIYAT